MDLGFFAPFSLGLSTLTLGALLTSSACSSSSSSSTTTGGGGSTGSGGPVSGPADTHCGSKSQTVNQWACCCGEGGSAVNVGGGSATGGSEYGEPLFNAEGDEDDCKYHLKWTSTDVGQNKDVTFTLELTTKSDGNPATGADPEIEAFLSDTHPAPDSDQKPTEGPAGTYQIGPVRFDAAGKWTIRFHLYETCAEGIKASPHGHGAFFLQVP